MRVCVFTSSFLPVIGGVELAVHHIASNLAELGHEVAVVTYTRGAPRQQGGYRLHSLPPGIARLKGRTAFLLEYTTALWLAALWLRWRYDVLNVHMAYPGGVVAALLKRWTGVKTVVTCHAADVQVLPELGYGYRLQPCIEAKTRYGLQMADAVTAVSQSVAEDVSALCPAVPDIYVVANGVAQERFRSNPANMRRRLGIGPEHRVVLAVGRNHPKKGYSDLVQAVGLLSRQFPDLRCVIVGEGTESLLPIIRDLGLEEIVLLTGKIPPEGFTSLGPDSVPADELVSLYMESDVFVLPSLIEGFPLVLPEAMMAGMPVVATRVAGNSDVVVDGVNGLLVPPADVVGLAAGIERVLTDDALRRQLSEGALRTAKQYTWREIASRYMAVYEATMSDARQATSSSASAH